MNGGMSASGTKRTIQLRRFRTIADKAGFWPAEVCPPMTRSGHRGRKVLAFKHCMRRGPYGGHMQRRQFIALLGGAATWPLAARAQEAGKVRRIGFLRVGPPPAAFIDGFRQGLREQGLVEDQHFVIEYSLAQSAAQVPDAAAELVRRKVDIIVASGTPSVVPARNAAQWCSWLP